MYSVGHRGVAKMEILQRVPAFQLPHTLAITPQELAKKSTAAQETNMVESSSSNGLAGGKRPRIHRASLTASLMILGAGLALSLLQAIPVQAQQTCLSGGDVCSQAYLDSLPFPIPPLGSKRVVQLVNCSCQTLLGAADAAHQSGKQGFPVFPREGTWIMQPYGTKGTPDNPNPNVLTIDIPQEWENTYCPPHKKCPSIVGPRFWARTGCRYDLTSQRAQCETGSCADHYDCSSTAIVDSGFTSLTEWTFAQPASGNGNSILVDSPDISLVDGANLNVDIEPVDPQGALGLEGICPAGPYMGQAKCSPIAPTDQHWLMYNYPLTVHGADLRSNNPATNQSCMDANGNSFILKRSDIDKDPTGTYGFVITDANGNPVMPPGDNPLACFSNCGKYEFPKTPVKGGACDPNNPNDPQCFPWLTYCAGNPGLYGQQCQTDQDCVLSGQPNVYASCYRNTNPDQQYGTCALRAFYQTPTTGCPTTVNNPPPPGSPASDVACTFTYGSLNPLDTNQSTQIDYSDQPLALPCANVTGPDGKLVPCVGDDTIHQVMHGAYTWPNDPETFDGDSPVYRIVFSPGGTSVPITPAQNQVPLCSDLPPNYNYVKNVVNSASSVLNHGVVLTIANNKGQPWPGFEGSQAANTTEGVLCRWRPAPGTESGCSPPLTDQYVTNSTCGLSATGTSLVSSSFKPNNGDPLFFEVAIATPDVTKPIDLPVTISGCVPSSGPGSWTQVDGGSLFFGSQTNPKQGLVAWYSGTSNNDGQSGSKCAVTVTLAGSAAATLKVYDVPGYNGALDATSSASGSYVPSGAGQPGVLAQSAPVTTHNQEDLMLGSLLQVNQQLTPITYWQDWLTNTLKYSPPATINCANNLCPAEDGTDYLSGNGPYSSNADAGHRAVGPQQQHALERRGEFVTPFNWGGVAIYIKLKSTPLALACPSSSAQVGAPYASPFVTTGGEPDYTYQMPNGGLPPGLVQLEAPGNPYIYGLPTTAGTYPYKAQVTDSAGNKASSNCSITVAP